MKNQPRDLLAVLIACSASAVCAQDPSITIQPQSQRAIIGSNANFNVEISSVFPTVSSGTLRLWLKADAGTVTNAAGFVSQWQDQSGNGNHASQSNTNLQPALVRPAAIGGMASLRFDGIQSAGAGDFLRGNGDVGIPDGYTSFLVYSAKDTSNIENIPAWVDIGGGLGAGRAYYIFQGRMAFATWLYDYHTDFVIPTNTYRIWTHRFNTNKTLIESFDATATTSTNINLQTGNQIAPLPGFFVGGFDPQLTDGRNFNGDIAELIYFRGTLSEQDRLAVETYLKQKYYEGGRTTSVTYQWRFNGTNVLDATNHFLAINNIQAADEGNYSVIVSNSFGFTVSSNAVLTLSAAPSITTQPQSQETVQGTNVAFNVIASGAFPLSYQWRFNNVEINTATNSFYEIENVQPGNGGIYSVLISDGITSVTSSNAILTVNYAPTITTQPQSRTVFTGTNVSFSVSATGHPLAYQWYFNSTNPIAGAVNASLILTNVTINEAGTYSVVVNNSLGDAPSSNAVLTVIDTALPIFEDFEPGIHDDQWMSFSPTVIATNYGGFVSSNHSLWFGGSGSRFAITRPIDVSSGGSISFHLRLANGTSPIWDRPELPYEGIAFEYSLDGISWTNIDLYNTTNFFNWTHVQPTLPDAAKTSTTRFRWKQTASSNPFTDHWALDDIAILPAAAAPSIVTQPQGQTLAVGADTTLTVQVTGEVPLTYQWFFDSNVALSTNSSLVLTNLQLGDSGNYSVVISNSSGSVTSAPAMVSVLVPPSISVQPQEQSAVQGTNVSFTVTASGAPLLAYQWLFNGAAISNAVDATLLLTNIQGSDAGLYSVRISNPVGTITSSNALLSIDSFPVILTQPQSQSVMVGSDVTFSIGLNASLPSVSSGVLRLWLKADVGVVTNANGFISEWRDQSGLTNHAFQANVNLQPKLVNSAAISNHASVRFDGIQSASTGDFLRGTGNVGIPDAYTSFLVYSANTVNYSEELPAWVGASGSFGGGRGYFISNQRMAFATWGYDFATGFVIPTNVCRIWTDRFNTNRSVIEFFDATASTSTNISLATTGQSTPAAGYYVGGLNPQQTAGRNFAGDIAELIYFRGSLSEGDRIAVENYLKQKYYQNGSSSGSATSYQWRFNGTNILGATNISLTLSNVQPTDIGGYSVVVSNPAGSTTSTDAILTVNIPPSITAQPTNFSVNAGGLANFSVTTVGTEPISYQWQKNSNNIVGATNANLILNPAHTADAGNYRVIVTSPFGTDTSSNATLSVNITTVRVVSTNATSASSFVLPIEINALGTENAVGFSLAFDPALLTFDSVALDSGLDGAILISNTAQLGGGKVGVAVALSADSTFVAGTQALVHVTFNVAVANNALNTGVNFVDLPTERQVSDAGAEILPAVFIDGTVAIAAVDFEGDVTPRPNGNRTLSITDWVQVGRFAAGLDTPAAGEFRRADCAPRADLGNGVISITDWVQAGRYATGIDPLTPVGGPSVPAFSARGSVSTKSGGVSRSVVLETTNKVGQTHTVSARLIAQGNENAIGFSLAFDPAVLTFTGATGGGNASGALLNVNSNSLAAGRVGVALSLPPGNIFAVGTQEVIKLTFTSADGATGSTSLTFTSAPISCEVSDTTANALAANFANATLVISVPGPLLTINMSEAGAILSWPSSASNFVLEASSAIGAGWTPAGGNAVTNEQSISTTLPISEQPQFYRLKQK